MIHIDQEVPIQKFDTIEYVTVLNFIHVVSMARCNCWVCLSTVIFRILSNIENKEFFLLNQTKSGHVFVQKLETSAL